MRIGAERVTTDDEAVVRSPFDGTELGRVPAGGPAEVDAAVAAASAVRAELTRGAYLEAFGAAFGIKAPKPTPGRLVKLFGGASAEGLLASQRVSNRKFRDASGWAPAYRDARVGWAAVAAARGED